MEQGSPAVQRPGRDLDIQVALKVMGYIWLKHLLQFSAELAVKWLGTADDIEASGGVYVAVKPEQFWALKERENHAEAVPGFSTDQAAAEQVVAEMEKRGCRYDVVTVDNAAAPCRVTFSRNDGETATASGAVVPEAVAKAALAFVACTAAGSR